MNRDNWPDWRRRSRGSQPFEAFFAAHRDAVAGYLRRRVGEDDADDLTAQVFIVAWGRLDAVPPPPEDRLWLFGVARRVVSDYRRATVRRRNLHHRLVEETSSAAAALASFGALESRVHENP